VCRSTWPGRSWSIGWVPVERLDLGLLVDRLDDRPLGRREVEPDHVGHLGNELLEEAFEPFGRSMYVRIVAGLRLAARRLKRPPSIARGRLRAGMASGSVIVAIALVGRE
jgi:hypothetical protein